MSALSFLHDRHSSPRSPWSALCACSCCPRVRHRAPTSTERPITTTPRSGRAMPTAISTASWPMATVPGPATARSSMTAVRPCRPSAAGVTAASPTPPTTASSSMAAASVTMPTADPPLPPCLPEATAIRSSRLAAMSPISWAAMPTAAATRPWPTAISSSSRGHDRYRGRRPCIRSA